MTYAYGLIPFEQMLQDCYYGQQLMWMQEQLRFKVEIDAIDEFLTKNSKSYREYA